MSFFAIGDKLCLSSGFRVVECQFDIRRGQLRTRLFRPFNEHNRLFLQDIPESSVFPILGFAKSIKIKMIEV